mgnify:CR=1 FL=1
MNIKYRIRDWYYTVRSWYYKFTTIKPRALTHRYCDATELLPQCMFEVFCQFMETEILKDCPINWDSDDEHRIARAKMQEIYDWWTTEYIPYFKDENEEMQELYAKIEDIDFLSLFKPVEEGSNVHRYAPEEFLSKEKLEEYEKTNERISEIDNLMDKNKKKYMHELVDIVDFLWT